MSSYLEPVNLKNLYYVRKEFVFINLRQRGRNPSKFPWCHHSSIVVIGTNIQAIFNTVYSNGLQQNLLAEDIHRKNKYNSRISVM